MAEEWTPQQQNAITGLYNELMAKPFYPKIDTKKLNADVFPSSGMRPFEEAKGILEGVLKGDYQQYLGSSHGTYLEKSSNTSQPSHAEFHSKRANLEERLGGVGQMIGGLAEKIGSFFRQPALKYGLGLAALAYVLI